MLQVLTHNLNGTSMGGRGSETNTLVGSIEVRMKLEEGITSDEVETFDGGPADDKYRCSCWGTAVGVQLQGGLWVERKKLKMVVRG